MSETPDLYEQPVCCYALRRPGPGLLSALGRPAPDHSAPDVALTRKPPTAFSKNAKPHADQAQLAWDSQAIRESHLPGVIEKDWGYSAPGY